jgi:Fe2+ transport system protein FeoA
MTTIDTPSTANFALSTPAVPLDQLSLGTRCRVEAVDENSESLLRLMEMGLTPGAVVVIEREAPLGSPYSLRLTGCTLAVRRDDARRVLVTALPDSPVEDQ